jgi:hypothetical protein
MNSRTYRGFADYKAKLEEEWQSLGLAYLKALIDSMDSRL